MNPAEVVQQSLPLTSSDLSLLILFWQAHWLVKATMLGLVAASIWVWATAMKSSMGRPPEIRASSMRTARTSAAV